MARYTEGQQIELIDDVHSESAEEVKHSEGGWFYAGSQGTVSDIEDDPSRPMSSLVEVIIDGWSIWVRDEQIRPVDPPKQTKSEAELEVVTAEPPAAGEHVMIVGDFDDDPVACSECGRMIEIGDRAVVTFDGEGTEIIARHFGACSEREPVEAVVDGYTCAACGETYDARSAAEAAERHGDDHDHEFWLWTEEEDAEYTQTMLRRQGDYANDKDAWNAQFDEDGNIHPDSAMARDEAGDGIKATAMERKAYSVGIRTMKLLDASNLTVEQIMTAIECIIDRCPDASFDEITDAMRREES